MIDTNEPRRGWYLVRLVAFMLIPWITVWVAVMLTIPMERSSAFIALAIVLVPVSLAPIGTSERGAKRWAAERGAAFTAPGIDQLSRHLTRTRMARTLGLTLGISLNWMLMSRYNADPETFQWFLNTWTKQSFQWSIPAFGYVIGSWWAEATKPRDRLGKGSGTAVLAPRHLRDYLDTHVRHVLAVFAAIGAASVLAWLLLPQSGSPTQDAFPWLGLVLPLAVSALAILLASWTCRRPELVRNDVALAYEELTRVATVNALAGVTVAMLGQFAGEMIAAPRDGASASLWMQAPILVVSLAGLSYWIACGTKLVFRTRRIETLRAAA